MLIGKWEHQYNMTDYIIFLRTIESECWFIISKRTLIGDIIIERNSAMFIEHLKLGTFSMNHKKN